MTSGDEVTRSEGISGLVLVNAGVHSTTVWSADYQTVSATGSS